MKMRFLPFVIMMLFCIGAYAEIVDVPDANFKSYLVGNTSINTNSDSEIQLSEAMTFTGQIVCNNLSIQSLKGIEAFIQLKVLWCNDNTLSSLDVSQNPDITDLRCANNNIEELNLSNNPNITFLSCSGNKLLTMDFSQNPMLNYCAIYNNNLSSIDVSKNVSLATLWCYDNSLKDLDVSKNVMLTDLRCSNNDISSLDISSNSKLVTLTCEENRLILLDISHNPVLNLLWCSNNSIEVLDLTQNTSLKDLRCTNNLIQSLNVAHVLELALLWCNNNALSELNVANGNNINFSSFSTSGNPNLNCVEVDDSLFSANNWMAIDSQTSYSEDCSGVVSGLDQFTKSISVSPQPTVGLITVSGIEIDRLSLFNSASVLVSESTNNQLDISDLPAGMYYVKVLSTDGNSFTKQVIKE